MLAEKLILSYHRGKTDLSENNLVLSKERVKDHAEVLTPSKTVSDMLDMVSREFDCKLGFEDGTLPLDKTFLEPACGTGNFLVQILSRKLKNVHSEEDLFTAVSTIYGVDIQGDNVLESRLRLLELVEENFKKATGLELTEVTLEKYANILEKNIILGDTLYEGVMKFEKKNGVVVPLKSQVSFKGGMQFLKNNGEVVPSELIPSTEVYERAYFYKWSWGSEPVKDYLDSEEKESTLKNVEFSASYFEGMF